MPLILFAKAGKRRPPIFPRIASPKELARQIFAISRDSGTKTVVYTGLKQGGGRRKRRERPYDPTSEYGERDGSDTTSSENFLCIRSGTAKMTAATGQSLRASPNGRMSLSGKRLSVAYHPARRRYDFRRVRRLLHRNIRTAKRRTTFRRPPTRPATTRFYPEEGAACRGISGR